MGKTRLTAIGVLLFLIRFLGCDGQHVARRQPFERTAQVASADAGATPWYEARAAELVARMDAAQKISQLGMNAPAIPAVGLPGYGYWNECLHGVWTLRSTSFPQSIALG